MDLKVDIDPEQINKYMSEQILKSCVGEKFEEQIKKQLSAFDRSWDNPFEHIIKAEIRSVVLEIVRKEFKEQLREVVKSKFTEGFVDELASKMVNSLGVGE